MIRNTLESSSVVLHPEEYGSSSIILQAWLNLCEYTEKMITARLIIFQRLSITSRAQPTLFSIITDVWRDRRFDHRIRLFLAGTDNRLEDRDQLSFVGILDVVGMYFVERVSNREGTSFRRT